jgi:hypothetical protein
MPDRPASCPWWNYPTHKKNRELKVFDYKPIVYGYCSQKEDCGSCAGTTYKPNVLLQLGRPHTTVPCPYCRPDDYRRRVDVLKERLPK